MSEWNAKAQRQFDVLERVENVLSNGARRGDDVECHPMFPNAVAARQTLEQMLAENPLPVPMVLTCPSCGERHIDEGEFASKLHHTHACQSCGMVWRPALVPTIGVQFLPGFKNEA